MRTSRYPLAKANGNEFACPHHYRPIYGAGNQPGAFGFSQKLDTCSQHARYPLAKANGNEFAYPHHCRPIYGAGNQPGALALATILFVRPVHNILTPKRTDKTTPAIRRLIYMTTNNSTTRFSNRVNDYVKYRPGYPAQIISHLQQQYNLTTDKLIADIGAGTGISTELFLKAGYRVIAVEPNEPMRDKAIELLGNWPGFKAQNGTAEDTGLATESIDAVIAGQAFHWFDAEKTRVEFERILKPNGLIALIWNERKTGSAFEKDYDELIIKHGKDYIQVDHRNIDAQHIGAFFNPNPYQLKTFYNEQVFDFDGLKGRLGSSSYMPTKDDEGYKAMLTDLHALFDQYQQNGNIIIQYDTNVYTGTVKPA